MASRPPPPKSSTVPGGDERALESICASIKTAEGYRCPKCKQLIHELEEAKRHVYGHVQDFLKGAPYQVVS